MTKEINFIKNEKQVMAIDVAKFCHLLTPPKKKKLGKFLALFISLRGENPQRTLKRCGCIVDCLKVAF